jgi:hypothetical protein
MALNLWRTNVIGKIQDKNAFTTMEEAFPTETIRPGDRNSVQPAQNRTPNSSLGVANAQDGFENAQSNDSLEKIGLGAKSVVDPLGYPGEEWLWQNTEEV